jgi:hypothetical protein
VHPGKDGPQIELAGEIVRMEEVGSGRRTRSLGRRPVR